MVHVRLLLETRESGAHVVVVVDEQQAGAGPVGNRFQHEAVMMVTQASQLVMRCAWGLAANNRGIGHAQAPTAGALLGFYFVEGAAARGRSGTGEVQPPAFKHLLDRAVFAGPAVQGQYEGVARIRGIQCLC